jgi:hypothetical protein
MTAAHLKKYLVKINNFCMTINIPIIYANQMQHPTRLGKHVTYIDSDRHIEDI